MHPLDVSLIEAPLPDTVTQAQLLLRDLKIAQCKPPLYRVLDWIYVLGRR